MRRLLLLLQANFHHIRRTDQREHQQYKQCNARLAHVAMHALLRELDHLHQRALAGGESGSQNVSDAAFVGGGGDVGDGIGSVCFVESNQTRAREQNVDAVLALEIWSYSHAHAHAHARTPNDVGGV